MKRVKLSNLLLLLCASSWLAFSQSAAVKHEVDLPSSKVVHEPMPGEPQRTNSLPVAVALSPDGKYLAILNNGRGTPESQREQSIAILDLASNQLRDFPDDRLRVHARQTYFLGLAWSAEGGELYASVASLTDPDGNAVDKKGKKLGGIGNGIAVYRFTNGALTPERFLKLPLAPLSNDKENVYGKKNVAPGNSIPYPAGIAVVKHAGADALLVAENLADDAVLIDARDGHVLQRFDLSHGLLVPTNLPYGVIVARDGSKAWCSLWNGSTVAELDLRSGKVVRQIALKPPVRATESSSHPTAMLLSPDEHQLYVALANRDQVAVIDAADGKVLRYFDTRLPGQQYGGNYPDALAQSPDVSRLYVADSSSDAVAVFDLRETRGGHANANENRASYFIPTEWYPTALAVRGNDLLIATGKGTGTGPNVTVNSVGTPEHAYIAELIRGSIARVRLDQAERDHEALTQEVLRSNRMEGRTGDIDFRRGGNPIKHVIYIMKENRTYDQVFGDIKEGNGEPALVMYGETVTPNLHKLARQFGVLDNFYDSGEVSGDGHPWSTSAISTDYGERTWPIAYRGNEREYDSEGSIGDIHPLVRGIPDVNEPATGYLWGNLARHGLSYRHYGEYVATFWCEDLEQDYTPASTGAPTGTPPKCPRQEVKPGEELPAELGGGKNPYHFRIPLPAYNVATKPELREHFDPHYPDFKVEYPDQFRADEFLREFAGFVQARSTGKGEQLPAFALVRLPNDHTAGTKEGSPTPNASVADNDLAVGRVVEAISNSPYWEDTAIFVIEDDAQDGVDHVDAHRSIALAISKYSPGTAEHPFVDHRFYTTVNMIHTMEALLGLPPMNNNDAFAAVMAPLFNGPGTQPAFKADYRNRDNGTIYQANNRNTPGAKESAKLDFSVADAADHEKLNAILWQAAKGNIPMPQPRHTVLPSEREK